MKHLTKIGGMLLAAWMLLTISMGAAFAADYAGTTADRATRVSAPTTLAVQSGSNFIRIESEHLPATLYYIPDTAFGPLPVALVMTDTLPVQTIFDDCRFFWKWEVGMDENGKLIEVKAHENALLQVDPYVCQTTYSDTTAAVCGGLEWRGEWYDQTGDYDITLENAEGCDSIRTLRLTVFVPEDRDTTAEVFDSLVWRGVTYTESGDYPLDLQDEHECDYTYTLHLTIHQTLIRRYNEHACDSFMLGDKKLTEGGEYVVDTVTLESGDRQIEIMDLYLGQTQYAESTRTECIAYTAPSGKTYTESGVYADTTTQNDGCYIITTLTLTLEDNCFAYDTAYFCRGLNTRHEEKINDGLIRRFEEYEFESPSTWDYMDGVILERESERTLVNLRHAEQTLLEHYTGKLTPIETIAWSVRYDGANRYTRLTVEDGPQWIGAGLVAVQIQFRCGEIFNSEFPTDVDIIQTGAMPLKRIENGQVVIIRGGEKYTVFGTLLH